MIKKSFTQTLVIILIALTSQSIFAQNNKSDPAMKNQPVPLTSFKNVDVGSPTLAGTIKVLKNGIDITAGGADIWGTKDEFTFAYIMRKGDFDIVSRIESLTAANLYTKAGIMAREALTADCRHIYFQVFSDNNPRNNNNGGYEFQYRLAKGGEMKAIYPEVKNAFPVSYPNTWIRLQRKNNEFTGYYSTDGKAWKLYTSFSLELPSEIYLGLAVTSHNTGHAASAHFRDISELSR
jgi:hypothetical protein